jgi:ubiquinone/menaquinone biosynthesis C-methylase UbiE
MLRVKLAKLLMNLLPNRPEYQEDSFFQEIFMHPNYISLQPQEKSLLHDRLVAKKILEVEKKPFDRFFPHSDLANELSGKRVLDLGCSIGGETIYCGEKWQVKEFYGIDVNENSIDIANSYASNHTSAVSYHFMSGYAENLPFPDSYFDAIISRDTIEHVRSVRKTMMECDRVLKTGGIALLVFPSFKLPYGGAHISSVTRTPFLEWIFSPKTINSAYMELVQTWDEKYNWFKSKVDTIGDWSVVTGGIGVNGTMYRDFMNIIKDIKFSKVTFERIPLLSIGNTANRMPFLRKLFMLLVPLLSINIIKDYLSHRLVFRIEK